MPLRPTRKPAIGVLDLGASGGRVFALVQDCDALRLEEIHRFSHSPQQYWQTAQDSGRKVCRHCWNLGEIYKGLLEGLSRIAQRGDLELGSFGVDTWGSDGTWVDASGDVLGLVATGRDRRWEIAQKEIFRQISKRELYHLTGIRSDPFCVLNQVYWYACHRPRLVEMATTYLSLNGLLHYFLCGERVVEHTWIGTTQLSPPGKARYHDKLFSRLRLPLEKMPPVVRPGTRLGLCHAELAEHVGLRPFEVIVPATHDTASAYLAAPVEPLRKPILISSGTWTLVGIGRVEPLILDDAFNAELTNIVGGEEMYFHAVIMGSWPAQELRRVWSAEDRHEMSWEHFDQLAASARALATLLDVDDSGFYTPTCMEAAVADFCRRTGQAVPQTRAEIARSVYEGLALKIALACDRMQAIAVYQADEVIVVGGGSYNALVNQWVADATGLPVRTGSANATALGNGLVQARSLGWISSLEEGRGLICEENRGQVFEPQTEPDWAPAKQRIVEWQK